MAETLPRRMTVEEFIPGAMARPEGEHYELVAGEIVAMAPERAGHARSRFRISRRLAEAIERSGLPCEVFPKWMAVRVDADTLYQPDVLVRCGDRLPDDALVVTDPLILVEVRSPSTGYIDAGIKLGDYFRIPTVRHYLIVDFKKRAIVHHECDAAGDLGTRVTRDGAVRLDPPGIDLADIFEAET
jgi:Uma2 family endonuclease